MARDVSTLKPKQEQAIIALMAHQSVDDAARAINIAPRTLYRWLNELDFDNAYRAARRGSYKQGIARLQKNVSNAISLLFKVLGDPATPPAVKLRGIECVLSYSTKSIEIEDIEARLAALEEEAKNKKGGSDK
jgi:hypothetical protein